MEAVILVASIIATATFVTGLLLPLSTRRSRTPDALTPEERYDAELAAGR